MSAQVIFRCTCGWAEANYASFLIHIRTSSAHTPSLTCCGRTYRSPRELLGHAIKMLRQYEAKPPELKLKQLDEAMQHALIAAYYRRSRSCKAKINLPAYFMHYNNGQGQP